jgi:hypothetical protein
MTDTRKNQEETVVPFRTEDGIDCNLIRVRNTAGDAPKGPVLLVHGGGVRAEIFRAPVETTVVDYLVDHGYEVWLENWRASIDVKPNQWNLDKAAIYDHPEAVRTVVRETGRPEIKAIIHCQGSTSFMMSAVAGLVPQVKTIVSNAVSLHPVIPAFSRLKMKVVLPPAGLFMDHFDPGWGLYAPTPMAKIMSLLVRLTHHECHNEVCKQVSFFYGSGFPALWRHENLNPETHEWLKKEFGFISFSFYRQMNRCVQQGHLVSMRSGTKLPRDFTAQPPQTSARFAFFSGQHNLCFLPESQVETYKFFDAHRPDYHSLHILPDYSHLDMFMGQSAARDVFPLMLAELDKN